MFIAKAAILYSKLKNKTKFLHSRIFAVVLLAAMSVSLTSYMTLSTHAVEIFDGATKKVIKSMRTDAKDIITQAGLSVGQYDVIETTGAGYIESIVIKRAFEVKVTADNETKSLMLIDGNVEDALLKTNTVLDTDDVLSHSLTNSLSADMHIYVDRVGFKTYEKKETLAYTVKNENTSTLKKGTVQVATKGQQGERITVYRDKLVNGKVVSTDKIDQYVSKEVVNEVRMVGTASAAPAITAAKITKDVLLDAKGQPVNYTKFFEGRATAYTAKPGAGTASGRKAMVGHVAVDPKKIPYGTKLYICSADGKFVYGYAIAADTGSAMRSGKALVDLYFNTMAECRSFGARTLRVYILS